MNRSGEEGWEGRRSDRGLERRALRHRRRPPLDDSVRFRVSICIINSGVAARIALEHRSLLTLHIVDRRVAARRRSRRDDLVRRESVRPGARQVVHEAGDPDEEQEKQEHQVEHEQGVQGHQLHRARATRFTITRVHPRSDERPSDPSRLLPAISLSLSLALSPSLAPSVLLFLLFHRE